MIYNADGGLVNGALDLLHKTFSPATYACRLCDVTYGPLGNVCTGVGRIGQRLWRYWYKSALRL